MRSIDKKEEREKEEVIDLLRNQIAVEGELVNLYEKTVGGIENSPVKHLLHTIQLDSKKHIDICQTAIDVLQGKDVLKPEKKELTEELQRHIELEKESIDRANKMLKNVWIRENKALSELIKKLRRDEKEHHQALKNLARKEFFRVAYGDLYGLFRDPEERYVKYESKKKKKEHEKNIEPKLSGKLKESRIQK